MAKQNNQAVLWHPMHFSAGEGLPGFALGAVEGISYLLATGALGTEVYKLVKGDIGG
jgi:hypothetical protein